MARDGQASQPPEVECAAPDCGNTFTAQRSSAKYCTATCRQRAGRSRKAATAEAKSVKAEAEADADGSDAEHTLVRAVRRDLEQTDALDTVSGQLALQFARRIADPDENSLSSMSKELRSLMADAKATAAERPTDGVAAKGVGPDDEVAEARRRREEMARRAASEAEA